MLPFCLAIISTGVAINLILAQTQPAIKTAFLKNGEIFISDDSAMAPKQLTADGAAKQLLTWSTDGASLAYFEPDREAPSSGRIVLLPVAGGKPREIAIHRPDGRPVGGFRFVESARWTANTIIISGSVNPSTCEYVTIGVLEQRISNDVIAECGSFVSSPDGTHSAAREATHAGASEQEWRDYLLLDGAAVYPQPPSSARILAGPVWDGNQAVAIIEKEIATGIMKATVVPLNGHARSMALPAGDLDLNVLYYNSGQLLISLNGHALAVDPSLNRIRAASEDEVAALARRRHVLEVKKDAELSTQRIATQNGGQQAIGWAPARVPQ
jgi:hypothetical protein